MVQRSAASVLNEAIIEAPPHMQQEKDTADSPGLIFILGVNLKVLAMPWDFGKQGCFW